MDWSNLAYFALLAGLVILMMRGCGGDMCESRMRRASGHVVPAESPLVDDSEHGPQR